MVDTGFNDKNIRIKLFDLTMNNEANMLYCGETNSVGFYMVWYVCYNDHANLWYVSNVISQ